MKTQLIVALDVPSSDRIPEIVDTLPDDIVFYKVGLELFAGEGPTALKPLLKRNKKVFLDLKLHDIPNTVARAVVSAARHGVAMLTVHAAGGCDMLKAAAESARTLGPAAPKLIAITTLTSLNDRDLKKIGVSRPLPEHTIVLGEMAISAGIDGLVCSTSEAADFRRRLGERPILVTPGIRLKGSDVDDQKRIATPQAAVKAGSNFLVVGRPILLAADPRAAAEEILRQMKQ